MPDSITPVGAMVQPVNVNPQQGINTLSGIIGIQQQKQNLATGAIQQQTAQAESQQAQQKNQELQKLAAFTKTAIGSPQYSLPDGSPDIGKFQKDAAVIAPTYGLPYIGQMTSNFKEGTESRRALQQLSGEQNASLAKIFTGVATNPKATESDFMDAVAQARSNNSDPGFNRALDNALIHANKAGSPQQAAANAVGALGGVAQSAPTQIDQGGSVQPGTTQTMGPGMGGFTSVGAPITKNLPPQVVKYPSGSLGTVGGAAGGPGAGPQGPPGAQGPPRPRTAQDDAPPPNAPTAAQEAYQQNVAGANAHVAQVRGADADYGLNMNLGNAIRRLSKNTDTGPGSATWQHALGAIGAPAGASNIANYQLLGAYLDRQAATLRAQMGLPATNEGVQTSQAIQGNTGYQREAIQDKNDLTQALVEGVHQYRNGLDKATGFSPNPSPRAVQQFRSSWTNNFDPNVFKLENAQKQVASGEDPKAVEKLLKTMPAAEVASLREKRKNLQALSQGQMP